MGRAGQERQGLPTARESTGQDLEQQGLEDEDELMLRRGILRPHGDEEEGQSESGEEVQACSDGLISDEL
jgi:hypothetical protein